MEVPAGHRNTNTKMTRKRNTAVLPEKKDIGASRVEHGNETDN